MPGPLRTLSLRLLYSVLPGEGLDDALCCLFQRGKARHGLIDLLLHDLLPRSLVNLHRQRAEQLEGRLSQEFPLTGSAASASLELPYATHPQEGVSHRRVVRCRQVQLLGDEL